MNIYFYSYFNVSRHIFAILLVFADKYHLYYTFEPGA